MIRMIIMIFIKQTVVNFRNFNLQIQIIKKIYASLNVKINLTI